MYTQNSNPKVFISYSWDSPEHQNRVLELANRLRCEGIDCELDQYEQSPSQGWPRWMENQVESAEFVLVICTEQYHRRFRGKEETDRGRGVTWEGAIITQELYDAQGRNNKFIPVVFSSQDANYIPTILRSTTYYILETEEKYLQLYRRLTSQPETIKPQLGKLRALPPRERQPSIELIPEFNHQSQFNIFEFNVVTLNPQGQQINKKGKAKYFTENLGNGITLEMVEIGGGKFIMGSRTWEGDDDEHPQHEVTIKPFYMGKFSVTQAQWKAIAALPKVERNLQPEPSTFKGDNRPVDSISWFDAVEFCKRLSKSSKQQYRLPSEAEWEYACRAGTDTSFHFGETITRELVNYDYDNIHVNLDWKTPFVMINTLLGQGGTTPVGIFPPNAFGLYDMHGNVWEWCRDTWQKNYEGAPIDGSAWINKDYDNQTCVLRGGSWFNTPKACRCANRHRLIPSNNYNTLGFRVVCDAATIT